LIRILLRRLSGCDEAPIVLASFTFAVFIFPFSPSLMRDMATGIPTSREIAVFFCPVPSDFLLGSERRYRHQVPDLEKRSSRESYSSLPS